MNRVLFVISTPIEYSSSANMRNLALIKGLIENDFEVDLLSDDYEPNSPYVDKELCEINFRRRYYLRRINKEKEETPQKSNAIITKLKQIASKVLRMTSVYDSRKVLVKNVYNISIGEKYDYMVSSSDPKSSHLIALHLIQNNPEIAKVWIQYWGDPFLTDINNTRIGFGWKKTKKEERKILSHADKIVYVSPFTLKEQQQIYSDLKDKMFFLPVPYYKEKLYKNNSSKSLGYFGDYYSRNRNIIPLYNCCKNNNYNITIMGDSDLKLDSDENISILPRQSKKIVEEKEKGAGLLVCVCNTWKSIPLRRNKQTYIIDC